MVLDFVAAIKINLGDPIFIGDFFGMLLALPASLFLAFWVSNVKNKAAVVWGAFAGVVLGFLVILGWADTLIFDKPLEGASGASVFFGSLLLCSATGLIAGLVTDLVVASRNARNYRRRLSHEEAEA